MAQVKMRYGIDLGTTNSAICRMENGEPLIKKTDVQKDILPSCVSFTKRKVIRVGDGAYSDLRSDKSRATRKWTEINENVFIEFKRTMGLDKHYYSSNMGCGYSSEELSAEVLKTLKSFVTDDSVNSAIITIPAKFKADQIAATKRAAKLAGFEHCELLQEPIAASMAYGLKSDEKEGYWLVFDFGGGTFDAALLKVEDGIMQVTDTEGNNYLGGKNLDYAIVDQIIIPYLQENYTIDGILADDTKKQILRDAMKFYAEQAKNQLSFKEKCDITSQLDEFGDDDEGEPLELDMVITQSQLKPVVAPIFQKAVDIVKELLQRDNLIGKLNKLILVGGPTYSPVLRAMLKEQITPNVDTSIDPMTAVAKGAALYASTIDTEIVGDPITETSDKPKAVLDISYKSDSVETLEFVSAKLLPSESKGVKGDSVFIELTRSDNAWSSGKVEVNDIGDVIECQLFGNKPTSFTIRAYDRQGNLIDCFPNEINFIPIGVGHAVLPFHIGIEVTSEDVNKNVFVPLKGLEKNQQLPATGVRNGLKTPSQLRPGNSSDKLVIPIYQGEHNAEGTSAVYNDHVFDAVITGDDIPALIPAYSDIDITIKVDNSQQMKLEVTFPVIGETVEKDIEVKQRHGASLSDIEQRLREAKMRMHDLQSSPSIPASETAEALKMLEDVEHRLDGEKDSDDGKMALLADIRKTFLKMEEVENNHEWESVEAQLRQEFDRLEKANNELGHKHDAEVGQMRREVDEAIRSKDPKQGRQVLRDLSGLFVAVTLIYQLVGFIRHYSQHFNEYHWKNATRARTLLNQGMQTISINPTVDVLHPLVVQVIDLLDVPEGEKPIIG